MKEIEIKTFFRDEVGKNKVKKLREKKMVPSVLYGGEIKLVKLSLADVERLYSLRHENFIIKMNIDGKEQKRAILKDWQFDPVTGKVIHIDFLELIEGKTITISIPIELEGTPEGVKKGGILEHHLWNVNVECLPDNIPDHIKIDISKLDIGDSIHIKDLKVPENVKIVDSPEDVVLTIVAPSIEEEKPAVAAEAVVAGEAAPGAAPAEPSQPTAQAASKTQPEQKPAEQKSTKEAEPAKKK